MAETTYRPALRTNRNLVKMIFLGLITCYIYNIVVITKIANELNLLAKDGKHTMHFCLIVFVFSWLTLGIVPLIWYHRICDRMGNELRRRGIPYEFGAGTWWGWGFFGSLIIVGPFIFTHKFCKASNMLNADFNAKG